MNQVFINKILQVFFAGLVLVSLSACASQAPPAPGGGAVKLSGLDSYNRKMFKVNMGVDRAVLKPAAKAYGAVPEGVRVALRNAIGNLSEPYNSLNHTIQGNFDYMGGDLLRLGINTTLGIGGLFDVAGAFGLKRQNTDLGITLGVWGVGPGSYLTLPLLGPSNSRDIFSTAAGFFSSPLRYFDGIPSGISPSLTAVNLLDGRQQLIAPMDSIEANSLDFFAVVQSFYMQQRANAVRLAKEHRNFDSSPNQGGTRPGAGGMGPPPGPRAPAAGSPSPGGDYDWGAEDSEPKP
ncbi:MAG: VacJ family lipoprotein [Alphaproteobacteria bacterium]|nr:VacJ family lipoprotein [Alphaproteobacteria bacterium]